jgi:chemotaxis protein CheX
MPSAAPFTNATLRDLVNKAMSDVLITMLALNSKLVWVSDDHPGEIPPSLCQNSPVVVGAVGFIGDINGLIYLHLEAEFAKLVTSKLVGLSLEDIEVEGDEVVNDAIGELTNMTVGGFKNALCDLGLPCSLTIPSILRGCNFTIEPATDAMRHVYQFETDGHRMTADLLLQFND